MKKIFESKPFKIITGILKTCVYLLLGLYIAFILFQRFSGNSSIMGYRIFTVASGSMSPKYKVNDVIFVKEVETSSLRVGDDIAYEGNRGGLEGLIITHRIYKIDKDDNGYPRFFTQGINNENPDPSIDASQILGKVQGKVPIINFLNHVVKNNFGFFFLVFCPLVFVIILEVVETSIENKIEKNEIIAYSKKYAKEEVKEEVVEVEKVESLEDSKPSVVNEGEDEDEEII